MKLSAKGYQLFNLIVSWWPLFQDQSENADMRYASLTPSTVKV